MRILWVKANKLLLMRSGGDIRSYHIARHLASLPSVLFQHNVESEIWCRHATNGARGVRKLIYGLEFSKMLRYEQKKVRRFDHVIAVSKSS